MPTILGFDRFQITFSSLEDTISADNEVRFIDAFVDKLDLKKLEIKSLFQSEKQKAGRVSFEDALFLKLYLYGYLNGIRSSRRLEKGIHQKCRTAMVAQRTSTQLSYYSRFQKNQSQCFKKSVQALCTFS